MDILNTVIQEYIQDLIEKKRNKIKSIEESAIILDINKKQKDKIYNLHQEINILNTCCYKLQELLKFISDLDD